MISKLIFYIILLITFNVKAINENITIKDTIHLDSLFKSYFNHLKNQLNKTEFNGSDANFNGYVINNLEKITGIKSEIPKSDYSFFKFTKKDFDNWENWYIKNKKCLNFNVKTKKLFLKNTFIIKIEDYQDL